MGRKGDSVAGVSASREDRILASSILATTDEVRIIRVLDSWAREILNNSMGRMGVGHADWSAEHIGATRVAWSA